MDLLHSAAGAGWMMGAYCAAYWRQVRLGSKLLALIQSDRIR